MTFYKNLILVLGLCTLSNFAHAAAAAGAADAEARPGARFMHITPDGAVPAPDAKQQELKAIAQQGVLHGHPSIRVIRDLDLHVDRLVDTDEKPIRGGYEDVIETDQILIFYENKVAIGAAGLRVGVETPAYLGGLVGRVKAPMILVIRCETNMAQCAPGHTHVLSHGRKIGDLFGSVECGEMYVLRDPKYENYGYIPAVLPPAQAPAQ